MGDLEIVTTMSFTLAAAYFISVWRRLPEAPSVRWRRSDHEALLSGVLLGIALWTKPTAGAFVWGVVLVFVAAVALRAWQSRRLVVADLRPYLRIAVLTGLACVPLGGVWYVRNILLGHEAVRFPPGFWLDRAAQSGVEWGWLLLALLLLTAYAIAYRRVLLANPTRRLVALLAGSGLLLLGTLPSVVEPRRLMILDWLLIGVAVVCVGWGLWSWWRVADAHDDEGRGKFVRSHLDTLFWIGLLGLPYFVTWFFSYSYDARLSFVIVPLMLLPSTLITSLWVGRLLARGRLWANVGVALAALSLTTPGMLLPLNDGATGWDGLWSGELPNDLEKQRSGNQALLRVVDGLQIYLDEHDEGQPLRVVAPGIQTLPFFFPLEDIRIDTVPWRLSELEGMTYFIDSVVELPERIAGRSILDNQVLGALRREDIMRRAWWHDDGTFSYDVYELHLENRFVRAEVNGPATQDIVFGGFVRYLGNAIGGLEFWQGRPIYVTMIWEPIAQTDRDYMIFLHLRDRDGNVVRAWDAPVALNDGTTPPRYYSTRVWEVGEYITDVRVLRMGEDANAIIGDGYGLYVGLYDLASGERVPMMVDGEPAGDSLLISDQMVVVPVPQS
jgi:hypothetical protein